MDRELTQTAAADFEAIRADLRATARLQKKVQRQLDEMAKEGRERQKEYEQRQKEYEQRQKEYEKQRKENEQRHKEYDRKFGGLGNRWGRFVESLVEGDLIALLQQKNIAVELIAERVRGKRNGEHFEFDIVAVNGEEAVVVEVKSTLRAEYRVMRIFRADSHENENHCVLK